MRRFVNMLAVALTLGAVALAADVPRRIGISLYTEQYLAILTAIAMPLLYLYVPASGARGGRGDVPVPWYDIAAAIVSCACMIYVAANFPALSELVSARPWDGLIVAGIVIVLVMEGLRRTAGPILTVVAVAFFGLALIGGLLPGELQAKSIPLSRLTYYLVWDSTASLGLPLKIVSSVVVMFTLFGITLFKSGGSAFFTDIAMALMGRYRGGPAKIAIVGSSLFGTISGSTVSNVLTTGVVTIPMMKRIGYKPHVAGAVEACASTGGQLMPPVMGIAAFIMAEFLQVSYAEVALAALIPAVLFYCALFIQVDLEAARNHMKPLEKSEIPPVGKVLKAGWYFPIPFVVLIYALFWLNYEAETAGLLATAVVLILAIIFPFAGKRINLHDIYEILRETGTTVLDLFMIGMAAGIIIGSLNYAGIGFSLTLSLLHLGGGTMIGLLMLAAFASIILGMGMPTVGVYILLATLIAPALIEMKIEPMAAHLFIMYFGCLSMITPPVCIGAFAAANIAGADPMRTGYTSMALGWTCFVIPFLFVFSNTLIMRGSAVMIVIDFVTAVAAVWLISAAIMGYSTRPLGLLDRCLYFVAGVCLMMPVNIFPEARYVNIVGALLGIGLLIWERFGRTERAAAPARSDA